MLSINFERKHLRYYLYQQASVDTLDGIDERTFRATKNYWCLSKTFYFRPKSSKNLCKVHILVGVENWASMGILCGGTKFDGYICDTKKVRLFLERTNKNY